MKQERGARHTHIWGDSIHGLMGHSCVCEYTAKSKKKIIIAKSGEYRNYKTEFIALVMQHYVVLRVEGFVCFRSIAMLV